MANDDWPFDLPPNCVAITLRQIVEGGEDILHVTHDLDDHGWQFLGLADPKEEDAAVVALSTIVELDSSVPQVADIPPGWHAWRQTRDSEWIREPSPSGEDQS